MAQARDRAEWSRVSHLLAMIHNRAGMGCSDPVTAADCNPYEMESSHEEAIELPLIQFASIFVPDLTPEQRRNLFQPPHG